MAMTVVVSGKIYNGEVYTYKNGRDEERIMYRGRLNYRDRTNGEWYWIDAVCWKDFGENGGLVGFLGENFDKDSGPKETGGQPIEIVGYIRPKEGRFTGKFKAKVGGKVKEMEVPNMAHPTYELVIETVDFPPNNEKRSKSSDTEIEFDDEINADEFEVITDDTPIDNASEEMPPEEDIVEDASKKSKKATSSKTAIKKQSPKTKVKEETSEDDDDNFFEED